MSKQLKQEAWALLDEDGNLQPRNIYDEYIDAERLCPEEEIDERVIRVLITEVEDAPKDGKE